MRKVGVFAFLFKVAPDFKFSTVRWGFFQFVLSIFYFMFSSFLVLFLTNVTSGGGSVVGNVFATVIFVAWMVALGFSILCFLYCAYIGIRWLRWSEDPTATKEDLNDLEKRLETKIEQLVKTRTVGKSQNRSKPK